MNIYYEPAYLQHHGVKGMKWGRRRYQNADGSLTPAGRKRYAEDGDGIRKLSKSERKQAKYTRKASKKYANAGHYSGEAKFYRDKANEITELGERVARKAESAARTASEQGGKAGMIKSRSLQVSANVARNTAAKARKSYDDEAKSYEYLANRANEKASKYATKKRVDIGKNEVDKIMRDSKKSGYEFAKREYEERGQEAIRGILGDTGYAVYDMIRDKRK